MTKKFWLASFCSVAVLFGSQAAADEITELLDEALAAYEQGDYVLVKENLGYVTQLLNQKTADAIAAVLPEPLDGWSAEQASVNSAGGAAMFGGGIQVSRSYTRGGDNITVNIVGESPLMSQMMMMLSNPALAGNMGKMVRIGKQRGVQTNDGTINLVFNNRFLVTVDGNADTESKIAYAQAIDFDTLQGL